MYLQVHVIHEPKQIAVKNVHAWLVYKMRLKVGLSLHVSMINEHEKS